LFSACCLSNGNHFALLLGTIFANISVSILVEVEMKVYKYYVFLIFLVSLLFLGGCYTQVAMRDYQGQEDNNNNDNYYSYDDSTNYDSSYSDNEYYGDSYPYMNDYYYGSPYHHRYYWDYYPSYSFGVTFGNYYDPFCWNPWE
jgi:hypothetical protein